MDKLRFRIILVTVTTLLLTAVAGYADTPSETGTSSKAFFAYLDTQVPGMLDRYDIPGLVIALVHEGRPSGSAAYGYADKEADRAMTVDAVCRVESISKSVSAFGIMKLVETGRIDLDTPVQEYLGDWRLPASDFPPGEVTIERLLSNSAGVHLGTIGEEYPPRTAMPSLRDYLSREVRIVRKPGTGFIYSNPGFNLLELLVEEVSGLSFTDYMAEEVLVPLGMENSSYSWKSSFEGRVPLGYEIDGTPVEPYVYPAKASGNLFATAEDIARFVSAEMTGSFYHAGNILKESSLREIHTPRTGKPGVYGAVAEAYGFGHFIEALPDGRRAVWHGGQGHGWMTHFHAVPETGEGIVILTNSQRSWPLISRILIAWSAWGGFGPLKWKVISTITVIMQVLIVLLVVLALAMLLQLVRGIRTGRRTFAPLAECSRTRRIIQAAAGLAGMAALAWSAAQPYLLVTSVFPGTAGKAGLVLLILALLLVVSSMFPRGEIDLERGPE